MIFSLFLNVFGGHVYVLFGSIGTAVLGFLVMSLWVLKPEWVLPYSLLQRGI